MLLYLARLVFYQIPLIHYHDQAGAVLLYYLEYIHILCSYTLGSVYHQNRDIGLLYGSNGTQNTVIFQIFRYLVLFANAGRIHKVEIEAELVIAGRNSVARCACYIGDNVAVFAYKRIYYTAFAYIRTTHYGKARNVIFSFLCVVVA